MRKLVSLKIADSIEPITFLNPVGELEEANAIEVVNLGGWKVVVKKGVFSEGELLVFAEVDTILDKDIPLFSFLEGKRIKTKKLKGVVSQGVCFTIPEILGAIYDIGGEYPQMVNEKYQEGDDWTEYVKAAKYDEYSSERGGNNAIKQLPQDVRGKFPSFIPKTDEERVQNLAKELKYDWKGKSVIIREKLHGASISIYAKVDHQVEGMPSRLDFGICSRNFELHLHAGETNNYVKTGLPYLHELLSHCLENRESIALQGELLGPGINGNPYNLPELTIRFFTAFDINEKYRYTDKDLMHLLADLTLNGRHWGGEQGRELLPTSVVFEPCPFISLSELSGDMSELLTQADAKSALYAKYDREGMVIRAVDSSFSFKVISNKWLLKEKD